jgi:DNA-binding transcriptional LysR family regulator
MALFSPMILVIWKATDFAAPVSSINFPNTAPRRKIGNHFFAKSTKPDIYVSVYASIKSRPLNSATIPATIGANQVTQEVKDGLLDLGVIVLPLDEDSLDIISIIEERLHLFVHSDHRLAARESITMKELEGEEFILFSEGFTLHDRVIEYCEEAGFSPKIAYESSQWDFINEMIGENLGVSILPQSLTKKLKTSSVTSVPIKSPRLPYKLGVVTKKGRYVSFASKKFIAHMNDHFSHS